MRWGLFIITIAASFASNTVYGQISSKEVDALVANAMGKFNVAGVAVAI